MIYSFDVFDTCLVRTFARPTDLFYVLAERMLCTYRPGFGREEVSELALARAEAERRAHAESTRGEIRLEDVYAQLPDLARWGVPPEAMCKEEMRLELESMRPVAPVKERVERLRAAGARVVFISDMYLPGTLVREMLSRHGFLREGDALYVSSDLGFTKRAGTLFTYVLEREGITAKELQHCGDGVESDFLGARKVGVRTELLTITQLNRFEKAMLRVPTETPWIPSQIAGLSRAVRLSFDGDEALAVSAEIASCVIAPLLTGFVLWALQDARARGLARLYFVARDGQILHEVAQALGEGMETPEARYLYGSRQAWYLPSVFEATRDGMEFVLLTGQSSAPRHNLKRVGLTPEALSAPLARHGFPPETWDQQLGDAARERFWAFVEDPEVAPVILQKAAEARGAALAYFEQEGLLKDDRWALVDVGWTLRTQGSLHKILASAGQPHTLGYYLGVSKARFSALEYGRARAYLLEEVEDVTFSPVRTLFQNKGLIDQVFTMADHGSTGGYAREGDRMVPRLSPLPAHPQREAFLRTVQALVTSFARELGATPLTRYEGELRRCARAVTGLLIAEPTRREARALAWAPISDDPNELRAVELAKPLSPADLFRIARDVFLRLKRGRTSGTRTVNRLLYKDLSWGFSWLEGSVALSGPWARLALWGFRTAQWASRERKALAAKPVAAWGRLSRGFRRG